MSKKKRVFTVFFTATRAAYARRLVTEVVLNLEPHSAGQRGHAEYAYRHQTPEAHARLTI